MPQAGFEPAIRASERPHSDTLDRAANGMAACYMLWSDIT